MKWRLWIIGAIVSFVLSLCVAMAGVAAGITWQGFVAVLGAALVTHFGAYVHQNPVNKIEFETEFKRKENDESNG